MRPGIAPEPYRMGRVGEISNLPVRPEPFCITPIGFANGKFASKILKRSRFEPERIHFL